MRVEILTLALIVGAFTWAFRYFPIKVVWFERAKGGAVGRFLATTGPAAIATLFTAAILPLQEAGVSPALVGGTVAVLASYWLCPSVVAATMAGALAYGMLSAI